MPRDASDALKAAETLYGRPLSPTVTKEIRELLEHGIARALGLFANIIMCDYLNRWNGADEKSLDRAMEAAERALSLADDVAVAHYAKAFIHRARGDHSAALAALEQSLKHNPGSVRARAQLAAEYLYLGQFDEALTQINQAVDNAAGSPALGMFNWIKGRTLFFLGRYEDAIPCLEASIAAWPDLWYNQLYLVSAQAHLGKTTDAQAALADFKARFTGYDTITDVKKAEQTNPNDNAHVVAGRSNFHAGLAKAGLPLGS